MLKDFVERIRPVYEALSGCGSGVLQNIRNVKFHTSALISANLLQLCEPEVVNPIEDLIKSVINEDVKYARAPVDLRNQRVYAVNVSRRSPPTTISMLMSAGWRQWSPGCFESNLQGSHGRRI